MGAAGFLKHSAGNFAPSEKTRKQLVLQMHLPTLPGSILLLIPSPVLCSIELLQDPTELGSNLSTLRCPKCEEGGYDSGNGVLTTSFTSGECVGFNSLVDQQRADRSLYDIAMH